MPGWLDFLRNTGSPTRIVAVVVLAVLLHLIVAGIRQLGRRIVLSRMGPRLAKLRTVATLLTSALVFTLYFWTLGLILREFGISLRTYLASASILGLAIGFGSQGLVQDVVTGLTVIFSNLFEVGDMVEIGGQTGIVKSVGLRFTVIENALGAEVFVPNRTITNVVNYPRGYVRALVDITLPAEAELSRRLEARVQEIMTGAFDQLQGIMQAPPSIMGRITTRSGKELLRVKFRLWPGRVAPIEGLFKQELFQALRRIDPSFEEWMISVNQETERKETPAPGATRRHRA